MAPSSAALCKVEQSSRGGSQTFLLTEERQACTKSTSKFMFITSADLRISDKTLLPRFMDLDINQMNFFLVTVKTAAISLGFSPSDASSFTGTLNALFNTRCAPPTAVPGINASPEL